jgi:hypothetical protein
MDRDCHPAWELLSPTGWVGGAPVDIDYNSGIDRRHERKAELFRGIPPREFNAGYFVFVDSFSPMSRATIKIDLVEEVSRIREIEHWPKRINGCLYTENMVDFAMAEVMEPRIKSIPNWHESIVEVGRKEWERTYASKYERIWRLLTDWAWAADERVARNELKWKKSVNRG